MIRILCFLVCDIALIDALISHWDEMGDYLILLIFLIALLTYGLIYYIKQIFG